MLQKNTPALTWHQISCKFFACKLSSLGPGAELLPQATEIDAKSMKNRGCVAVSFLDRFWMAKSSPHTQFPGPCWRPLSTKIAISGFVREPSRNQPFFGHRSRLPAAIVPPPGLGKIVCMRKFARNLIPGSMQECFFTNFCLKN